MKDYIAFDTIVTVDKGKVWEITSAKSFMIKENYNPYENDLSLWINDQIIYYYKSMFDTPVWLPEGRYEIKLMSYIKNAKYDFISYISGIEYIIENKN